MSRKALRQTRNLPHQQIPGSGEKHSNGTPLPPRGHDPERDRRNDGSRLRYGKCCEKEASGHAAKRPDASGALQRPGGRLSSRIKT
jgi:hypothetical protein